MRFLASVPMTERLHQEIDSYVARFATRPALLVMSLGAKAKLMKEIGTHVQGFPTKGTMPVFTKESFDGVDIIVSPAVKVLKVL